MSPKRFIPNGYAYILDRRSDIEKSKVLQYVLVMILLFPSIRVEMVRQEASYGTQRHCPETAGGDLGEYSNRCCRKLSGSEMGGHLAVIGIAYTAYYMFRLREFPGRWCIDGSKHPSKKGAKRRAIAEDFEEAVDLQKRLRAYPNYYSLSPVILSVRTP